MSAPAPDGAWIFGYGSLIWRPGFAFAVRRRAAAHGWARRFQQRSTDHRGTHAAPGRVATMIAAPGERCIGAAYRIAAPEAGAVLAELDVREQQGYQRIALDVALDDGVVSALTYVAPPGNPWFVTGESLADIAAIVRVAHGPSGANLEYAKRLASALAELDARDPQLDELLALAEA